VVQELVRCGARPARQSSDWGRVEELGEAPAGLCRNDRALLLPACGRSGDSCSGGTAWSWRAVASPCIPGCSLNSSGRRFSVSRTSALRQDRQPVSAASHSVFVEVIGFVRFGDQQGSSRSTCSWAAGRLSSSTICFGHGTGRRCRESFRLGGPLVDRRRARQMLMQAGRRARLPVMVALGPIRVGAASETQGRYQPPFNRTVVGPALAGRF